MDMSKEKDKLIKLVQSTYNVHAPAVNAAKTIQKVAEAAKKAATTGSEKKA